jgi:type I restriction enzyme S subunit
VTEEQNNLPSLPEGWTFVTLPDIVDDSRNSIKRGPFGSSIKKEYFVPSGYKVYQQKNVIQNNFDWGDYFIDKEKFSELRNFELKSGDIVITCSGTIGKIAVVPSNIHEGIINQALLKITLDPRKIRTNYFFYLFKSKVNEILSGATRGSAMKNISSVKKLKSILFPLPPFNEQKRIVEKVEELFTRLDAGVASLRNVKAQLQLYRKAVLIHAFNGKLTEEWRKTHKDTIEPATTLLEQIRQERKKKEKEKYREPPQIDTSNLPELPETWTWTTIDDVSRNVQYGYTAKSSAEVIGPKMLRITDIQDGSVKWDSVPYCAIDEDKKPEFLLRDGDLVFARTGATVGKSFLIAGKIPEAVFASYLIRIVFSEWVSRNYVYAFFQSPMYWSQIYKGRIGIGQPNVNSTKLKKIYFPFPSFTEQNKIYEEIDSRFSVADAIENVVNQSMLHTERLRQSLLKIAFEGRLVGQDPSDESAERLLERIRKEKEMQSNQNKGKTRRKTSKRNQRSLNGYVE